jgi:hypothetical protein
MRVSVRVAAIVVAMTSACSGGDAGCDSGSDCPFLVTRAGIDYTVSCAAPPRRLVGAPVDVTSQEERDFGDAYAVEGYELEGIDPDEALALTFAQRHCSRRGHHAAFAWDLPQARLEELERTIFGR